MLVMTDEAKEGIRSIAKAMLSNDWASTRRSGGTDGDITLSKSTLTQEQCDDATITALWSHAQEPNGLCQDGC